MYNTSGILLAGGRGVRMNQAAEAVAKLLGPEKSMILRPFEGSNQAATAHPTRSTPSGSIEEDGLKGSKKGDFNGQMSFATASVPKQFLHLQGKMIVLHSFDTLVACPYISEIIIVCEANYRSYFTCPSKPLKFALPGERRQDSVYNGLQCISHTAELVCIHDSARPFLLAGDLLRVIEEANTHGAAVLGSPVKNTLKENDGSSFIKRTIDRSPLWEVYTPQVMTPALLRQGYAIAHAHNHAVTDDVSLVELTGHPVKLVHGSSKNTKITTPEDLLPV